MKQILLPIAGLLLVVILSGFMPGPEDKVVFLDVGQGDATLLQSGTQQVLIDGGQGMAVLEPLARVMPWFDSRIEVVILTHPHQDHMEGLLHILDRYEVGMVILPRVPAGTNIQANWLQKLIDTGVDYRFGWHGQRISLNNLELQILAPFDNEQAHAMGRRNLNEASVVVRADFHDKSFLLTGDAERWLEYTLVQNIDGDVLDVDILKAGHHGSNTSSNVFFLPVVNPSAATISAGEDNRHGHPHPEVLERLGDVPVWRTDKHGSISFLYDGKRWLLACEKMECAL